VDFGCGTGTLNSLPGSTRLRGHWSRHAEDMVPAKRGSWIVGRLPPGSRRRPASIAAGDFRSRACRLHIRQHRRSREQGAHSAPTRLPAHAGGEPSADRLRRRFTLTSGPRFSTRTFRESASEVGDKVRIVVTDHADARPVEDILWTMQRIARSSRKPSATVAQIRTLGREDEPYMWVNELEIAPWAVYVLERQ